ncbi:MAG TPA: lipoprotein insertase outer membrane protein LolB [Nevskia sp.]|nr:lipoprotein insertase outer membrane protein LolB [Nevskia sp.]
MRLPRALLAGAAALLLAGCFNNVQPESAGNSEQAERSWAARRAALQHLHSFTLQGRLAESGLVSFGGALSWMQDGEEFQARFYGPLGVGAVAISGTPEDMEVRSKDGIARTRDPEAFMQQQFGWSLPLRRLRHWVLGLPAPDGRVEALKLDESGRILSLRQDGWELAYTEYQTVAGLELPKKFTISDSERGFKVFVDQWVSVQ